MSYRILIVEDHPVMREAYVSVLSMEPGIDLCGAVASAEDALVALDSLVCDLLVTDYALPGMTGVDLVRRLHEERPELPTLVISGHEEDVFVREALHAGAVGFLTKRDLMDTLVPTIHEVMDRRRSVAA